MPDARSARRTHAAAVLIGLALALAAAAAIRLLIGRDLAGSLGLAWPDDAGIQVLRLERVAAAVVVGACLGLSGAFLQALLRNPLAAPDLVGASSGASLAVVAHAALFGSAGMWIEPASPLLGSLAALAIVYTLAQRRGIISPVSLILVGVMVSTLCGALITLIVSLMPDRGIALSGWLLGSIRDDAGHWPVALAAIVASISITLGTIRGRDLDILTLDDTEAASLGVRVQSLRLVLFVLSGALAAAAVVVAGPIGFVGLVAPHLVRSVLGPTHRTLIPSAAMAGAILVLAADIAARAIDTGSGRLPTGVITALVGGPIFLVMLRGRVDR